MKKITIIIPVLLLLLCAGCNKFLDVRPDENTYEEEIFKTENGFTKALNAVYKDLTESTLYGEELKYGLMDKLVGYWQLSGNDVNARAIDNYNYSVIGVEQDINALWSGLYNAIHQTNLIIKNLPTLENQANYNIIAGEAYGLRAFLHLEVLKLFGPVIKQEGLDKTAIPVYRTAGKEAQKFSTAKEALAFIEEDLQKALSLLKEDPIQVVGRAGSKEDSPLGEYYALFDRRGIRMNYYAVKALLARKSQWEGDNNKAYDRAMEVINELNETKAVKFVDPYTFWESTPDLRFASENIFAVYDNDAVTKYNRNFLSNDYVMQFDNFLYPLYYNGTGDEYDIRINWGIDEYSDTFSKFKAVQSDVENQNYNVFEIQLIALPEMYFIAMESKLQSNPTEALELLNEVRLRREMGGLELESPREIENAFMDEIRREYIGEGFLFSHYKRRFHEIYKIGKVVPPSLDIFKLPIPRNEQIYNR